MAGQTTPCGDGGHHDGVLPVLHEVAQHIIGLPLVAARIAVDGPDGAGKTHFANHLASVLRNDYDREVIRISIDDFHNTRAVRYQQGRHSPQGFWADSYDYTRFHHDVLEPLAPTGTRRYRSASHDLITDEVLDPEPELASPTALLVVDGIFLHRTELISQWDLTIFLDVAFVETAIRMAERDRTPADPEHPQLRRYVEGQRLYFDQCHPQEKATILIDNNDLNNPRIVRGPGPQAPTAAHHSL